MRQKSKQGDQFSIRFPVGMRGQIKELAEASRRTMAAEVIFLIEKGKNAAYGAHSPKSKE